jgi:hypothetical protein
MAGDNRLLAAPWPARKPDGFYTPAAINGNRKQTGRAAASFRDAEQAPEIAAWNQSRLAPSQIGFVKAAGGKFAGFESTGFSSYFRRMRRAIRDRVMPSRA